MKPPLSKREDTRRRARATAIRRPARFIIAARRDSEGAYTAKRWAGANAGNH